MKKTILSVFSFLLLLGSGLPTYAAQGLRPDGNSPEMDDNLKSRKRYKVLSQIQTENLSSG